MVTAFIVEADDAGVGDRDAEDVADEIIEYCLLALAPGRVMDDPGPGVQDGEHADRRSDVTSVVGEFDDGQRGGPHQQGVPVALMAAQRVAKLLGHGDRKIARWQNLGHAGLT